MNHIYRLVWNSAKGVWQAVAEHARGSKKAAASHENRAHHTVDEIGCSPILGKLAGALFLAFPMPLLASDLPQGGSIVGGSGQISQSGATMTVTQTSERMAADWQSFNIGAGHTVNFVQPSASAAALNRVVGADVSLIQGALNANGQVFLVNPNGILFSPTAQVNVGGLIASTLGVSTADFMAGKYNFEGAGSNAIINRGNIVATGASDEGGTIALIAAKVINEGVLTASAGNVLIGAGTKVTLDLGGPVKLQVEQGVIDALIEQGGAIKADGGLVYLSAKAAGDLAATVINHTGITQAQTLITGETGEIFLMGGLETDRIQVGGRLDASAPRGGDGGFIETSAAKVRFDDDLAVTTLAPQGHTGHWLIDPNDFTVAASGGDMTGAFLSSSLASNDVTIQSVNGGTDGNGDIFVNDAVTWNSATRLTLDAIRHIEINADISALHSNGELALMYGQGAVAAGNTAAYSFGPGAKVNLRAGDNFFTMLGNDGTEVAWKVITSLGASDSVTGTDLQGMRGNLSGRYALGADIDASPTSSWVGGFTPVGSQTGNAFTGSFEGMGHVISSLMIESEGNNALGLFGHVSNPNSTVRNVGLEAVDIEIGAMPVDGGSHTGSVVGWLEKGWLHNVYATGEIIYNGGEMVGGLIGLLGMLAPNVQQQAGIFNSYADVGIDASAGDAAALGGLVGRNGGGSILNSYASGAVRGKGVNEHTVGGLVGQSIRGSVSSSHATGSVSGSSIGGAGAYWIGGLIGLNTQSSISDSYSTGTVSGTGQLRIGGLVGENSTGSSVSRSYTSGAVSASSAGGLRAQIGGLAGVNVSAISDSYASGALSVTGLSNVGGLVGENASVGLISNSFATGAMNIHAGSYAAGGLVASNRGSARVENSFWDIDTTGHTTSAGGIGRTSAEMKSLDNYSGWNISAVGWEDTVWRIYEGGSAPLLRSFLTQIALNGSDSTISISKVYDGTTSVDVALSDLNWSKDGQAFVPDEHFLLGGLQSSDKDVGIHDTLSNYYSLNNSSGYDVIYGVNEPFAEVVITPKALTINGSSAQGREYDGSTNATINVGVLAGLVGDETLIVMGQGTFDSKNVGTHNVAAHYSLENGEEGGLASNYSLADETLADSASITARALTISGSTVQAREYDGTTDASVSVGTLVGLVVGETLAVTANGVFNSKDVDTANSVDVTYTLIDGTGALSNYSGLSNQILLASIAAKTLTIDGSSVQARAYDGTTNATVSVGTLTGLMVGETLSVGASGIFNSKDVETADTVTVTYALSDGMGLASNYRLLAQELDGSITAKTLTISGSTVQTRQYDGTTDATVDAGTLTGLVAGETLAVTASGIFNSKNVNTADTVAATYKLGDDTGLANNYYLLGQELDGAITAKTLAISGSTVQTREYDGTTDATISAGTLTGLVAGETLSVSASGIFNSKDVATAGTVTASYVLGNGTGLASNYSLAAQELDGAIAAKALTINGSSVQTREYDGTTNATVNAGTLAGLVVGETLSVSAGGAFNSKDVATADTVAATYVLSDDTGLASNYNLAGHDLTGSITARTLTINSSVVESKTYDGTTNATVKVGTLVGLVDGETLQVNASGIFNSKDVETANSVDVTYALTDGTGLISNYSGLSNQTLSASIAAKKLTISGSSVQESKAYDGTTNATVTAGVLHGLVDDEKLGVRANGVFNSKDVLTAKAIDMTYILSDDISTGGLSSNYSLLGETFTASITAKALTIDGSSVDGRVYDGTTDAMVKGGTLNGMIGNERLVVAAEGAFDSKNAGARTATAHYTLSDGANGGLAGNYTLADSTGHTATITPKALAISDISASDKIYDGSLDAVIDASSAGYDGLIAGDQVIVSATGVFSDKHSGTDKTVTLTSAYTGSDVGNYRIADQETATATIARRPIVVVADDKTKSFGTEDPVLTWHVSVGSLVSGDTLSGSLNRSLGEDIGQYEIFANALFNEDYQIAARNGVLRIEGVGGQEEIASEISQVDAAVRASLVTTTSASGVQGSAGSPVTNTLDNQGIADRTRDARGSNRSGGLIFVSLPADVGSLDGEGEQDDDEQTDRAIDMASQGQDTSGFMHVVVVTGGIKLPDGVMFD